MTNKVQFQANDIEEAIKVLTPKGASIGPAARSDLARYYASLDVALSEIDLTEAEARSSANGWATSSVRNFTGETAYVSCAGLMRATQIVGVLAKPKSMRRWVLYLFRTIGHSRRG
jgi:hypothetical protein